MFVCMYIVSAQVVEPICSPWKSGAKQSQTMAEATEASMGAARGNGCLQPVPSTKSLARHPPSSIALSCA